MGTTALQGTYPAAGAIRSLRSNPRYIPATSDPAKNLDDRPEMILDAFKRRLDASGNKALETGSIRQSISKSYSTQPLIDEQYNTDDSELRNLWNALQLCPGEDPKKDVNAMYWFNKLASAMLVLTRYANILSIGSTIDMNEEIDKNKETDGVYNRTIQKCLVSLPTYLWWKQGNGISGSENKYSAPDRIAATFHHFDFFEALVEAGAFLSFVTPTKDCTEQVYIQDILKSIGKLAILCNMADPVRQKEMATVLNAITPPPGVIMEGGSIIPYNDIIFLGIGKRTNMEAAYWLQEMLGNSLEVVPLFFRPDFLPLDHLDCTFNPLPNGALIYPEAFDPYVKFKGKTSIEQLGGIFTDLRHISYSTYIKLALNFISVSPPDGFNTVILNGNCQEIHKDIHELGGEGTIIHVTDLPELNNGDGDHNCSQSTTKSGAWNTNIAVKLSKYLLEYEPGLPGLAYV